MKKTKYFFLILLVVFISGTLTTYASLPADSEQKTSIIELANHNNNEFLLQWGTMLGGSASDSGFDLALDSEENVIVTGSVSSSDYPTLNAFNSTFGGVEDAILSKLSKDGELLWSTYYGGVSNDVAVYVEVDSDDNIIMIGYSISDNLPMKNSYISTIDGFYDIFITKFTPDGDLTWSTYFGGTGYDNVRDAVIDEEGNIYITGYSESSNLPMVDSYNSTYGGGSGDMILCKFSPHGQLLWSTFIGGNGQDIATGIDLDSDNNLILVGFSTSVNFPVTDLSFPYTGSRDGVLLKFSAFGDYQWGKFFGGTNTDSPETVLVDRSSDDIYIAGYTSSLDFPLKNPFDSYKSSSIESFMMRYTKSTDVVWSTYIGGNQIDYVTDLHLTPSGNIVSVGSTESLNFPTYDAYNFTYSGLSDGQLMEFSPDGKLVWSTYFGGSGYDTLGDLEISPYGDIYFNGFTQSQNFPVRDGFDSTLNGTRDSILVKYLDPIGDSDQDGISNIDEHDMGTKYMVDDTDGDGMTDGWEYSYGLDLFVDDAQEDLDQDGMPNGWEFEYGFDPADYTDGTGDADSDGLQNSQEYSLSLDPNNPDTDGDMLYDGQEVYTYQTDPTIEDTDGDGRSDGEEVLIDYTNPLDETNASQGENSEETSDSGFLSSPSIYSALLIVVYPLLRRKNLS